jgi:hypothetical protein
MTSSLDVVVSVPRSCGVSYTIMHRVEAALCEIGPAIGLGYPPPIDPERGNPTRILAG